MKLKQTCTAIVAFLCLIPWASADTLKVGLSGFPRTKGHPYAVSNLPAIYTFTAIFDALTYINAKGELEPWLADSWERTSPETWVFKLKPNVTFSNGEPLTAASVVASVNYLVSPEGAADTVAAELASLKSATALDLLTVEITTDTPNPILDREVSALRVIPSDYWSRVGPEGFMQAPVGTGPFEVEQWSPAEIKLAAFEQSWRPPNFDRLELKLIPEALSRVQGLISGGLDLAVGLSAEDAAMVEAAGLTLEAVKGTGVFVLALNPEKDPRLRDVRVRRALNYAINKQQMIDVLLDGRASLASQFTPPNALGYNPDLEPYLYDPERAKALLAEAGYPDGFSFIFEGVPSGSISGSAIFQQVARDLAAIGVNMEIRPIQLFQLSAHMHNGTWAGSAFGVDYGTAPSLDTLRSLRLHSCLWKTPWYCDREAQPLVDAAINAPGLEERKALSRQIMARYHDQAAAILLWDISYFMGMSPSIKGFEAVGTWIVYDRMDRE